MRSISQRAIGRLHVGCVGLQVSPALHKSVIETALLNGINLLDTDTHNIEALVHIDPKEYHLALVLGPGGAQEVHRAMQTLRKEQIELVQVDMNTEGADLVLEEIKGLREKGVVGEVGLINANLSQVNAASKIYGDIRSVQNRCNLIERQDLESGLVSALESRGMAYLPRAALGGEQHRRLEGKLFGLKGLADKHEASISELMLSWLLLSPHIIPIPGAATVEQVESCAHAAEIELDLDDLEELERVVSNSML
jgi:aryl-alcohol dehydrogenase-like predicted oxidoreductase